MKLLLNICLAAMSLALAEPAFANDALSIDKNGVVNIPGKLATGSITTNNIQAGNLDETLKTLLQQNQNLLQQNERLMSRIEILRAEFAALNNRSDRNTELLYQTINKCIARR